MSVGIHSGTFELVLLGRDHHFLLAFGPDATTTFELEKHADAGEVLISPRVAAALPAGAVSCTPDGDYLVKRRFGADADDIAVEPRRVPVAPEAAARFVQPMLRADPEGARSAAGHRPLTTAFVGVRGLDAIVAEQGANAAAERLHRFSIELEQAVRDFDVAWTSSDATADGCQFMTTSGLLRMHEDDDDRMLLVARRMVEADLGLQIAVGLNRGRVFVGDVGHPERRASSPPSAMR